MASGKISVGRMTLLWTNPSPTASFAAQSIPVDLSSYDFLLVFYRQYATNSSGHDALIVNDTSISHNISTATTPTGTGTAASLVRSVSLSSSDITFGSGLEKPLPSGTRVTNDSAVVPYRIYGVKA